MQPDFGSSAIRPLRATFPRWCRIGLLVNCRGVATDNLHCALPVRWTTDFSSGLTMPAMSATLPLTRAYFGSLQLQQAGVVLAAATRPTALVVRHPRLAQDVKGRAEREHGSHACAPGVPKSHRNSFKMTFGRHQDGIQDA